MAKLPLSIVTLAFIILPGVATETCAQGAQPCGTADEAQASTPSALLSEAAGDSGHVPIPRPRISMGCTVRRAEHGETVAERCG